MDYETKCIEPIERRGFDNGYWIWEYPNYEKNYIVVADVARGDGAEFERERVVGGDGERGRARHGCRASRSEVPRFCGYRCVLYRTSYRAR